MSINQAAKVFQGPWEGASKVAIGIDIGTTQSGVAFAFLQQGEFGLGARAEQTIHRVTQWPGQESQNQHGKIPTVVWYDSDNKAVSFGAEALSPQAEEEAEDNHWRMAKYFKLHLHPADLTIKHELRLRPLPAGVTLSQIYSDFLGYLLHHTRVYFEDHILDGKRIWQTYGPALEVIIAHPNGWGIKEQTFLRSAAVKAGFTKSADAISKVHFVSEAEASVHFCMFHTNLGSQLNLGATFAVCDAGGSTVDTTVYSVNSTSPLLLEETRASDCVQAGAIFIDEEAEKYLRRVLTNAELDPEDIEEYAIRGTKDFENNAKRAFRDVTVDQTIEIASTRTNNLAIRVRRGRMSILGPTVKTFFDPCISQIISSVENQLDSGYVSYILLVGGFGESLHLRAELKACFEPKGCQVTTTSDGTSKAVADGALIWFSSNRVVKRAPWFSYGVEVLVPHNPQIQSHRRRKTVFWPSGEYSKGGWSQIVTKGIPIDCDTVNRRSYSREYSNDSPNLGDFSTMLWGYSLPGTPEWMRFKPGSLMPGFKQVCTVKANLNILKNALKAERAANGTAYRVLKFAVCIHFGRTELNAYVEWDEGGVTCIGPAQVITSSDFE